MPKELEDKLKREASSKGLKGDRADAYVYGTMRKTGWKPEREKHGTEKRHIPGGSAHDHVFVDPSINSRECEAEGPMGMPYDSFEYSGGNPCEDVGMVADQAGNPLMSVQSVPNPSRMYDQSNGKFRGGHSTSGLGSQVVDIDPGTPRINYGDSDGKDRNYPSNPGAGIGQVQPETDAPAGTL